VRIFLKLSGAIDSLMGRIGQWVSWLVVVAVIVSAANASIRKVFDISSNAWLELQWVLFSAVFLCCAAWTLLNNEHIRIDILNNMLPKRVRNSIDVMGHLFFLLPLTLVMLVTSLPFFLDSAPSAQDFGRAFAAFGSVFSGGVLHWPGNLLHWLAGFLAIGEQSSSANGLPQWPSKALVFIGFLMLFLQAISELIKRIAVMRGTIPDPHERQDGQTASELEAARLLAAIDTETAPR
jgi:TRAP-type mannitol/chloroaromatic compound transport system permease small subunit